MLSQIPINLARVKKQDLDRQIVRAALIAELDAINLYEQLGALATSRLLRVTLLDVAKEEKTHVGEFEALLLALDKEQWRELKGGTKEVAAMRKA